MRAEAALRTHAHPLQRFLPRLPGPFGHEVSRLVEARHHLRLVLQAAQLGRDDPHDDVLVLRQVAQGLEPARALGVVLEVEGVDVEVTEEFGRDDVVGALGEVAAADEVAAAQVHARVHVGRAGGDAVVVQLDVGVEQVVDCADVVGVLFPALAELFGAEVCGE